MSENQTESRQIPKWRTTFEVTSTIVMIAFAGVLAWQGYGRVRAAPPKGPVIPVPKAPISVAANRTLGAPGASVVMVVYSDFECPFCGTAARDILPVLVRQYVDSGRIRLAFKNLPLQIHPLAAPAAAAALCAGEQHKFWAMHDRLFSKPTKLDGAAMRVSAQDIGVDATAFESCLSDPQTTRLIDAEKAEANGFGITGTPTFVFGTITQDGQVHATDVLAGAKPVESFKAILDRLLKTSLRP